MTEDEAVSWRFLAVVSSFSGKLFIRDRAGLDWEQIATRYWTSGDYGIYFGLAEQRFVVMHKGLMLGSAQTFAEACDNVQVHGD